MQDGSAGPCSPATGWCSSSGLQPEMPGAVGSNFAKPPRAAPVIRDYYVWNSTSNTDRGLGIPMDDDIRRRLTDLDRKLDELSFTVCHHFDNVSLELSQIPRKKDGGGDASDSTYCPEPVEPALEPAIVRKKSKKTTKHDFGPLGTHRDDVSECGTQHTGDCNSHNNSDHGDPLGRPSERMSRQSSPDERRQPRPALRHTNTSFDGGGMMNLMMKMGDAGVRDYKQTVWSFLEDPDSSVAARWFPRVRSAIIWISVLVAVYVLTDIESAAGRILEYFNLSLDVYFLLELLLRYSVCRSSSLFMTNPNNMVDIVAIALPLYASLSCLLHECEGYVYSIMCFVPVLRLLKSLRHFQQFHLFIALAKDISEAISVLCLLMSVLVLTFTAIVYLLEPRDNIETFPVAMYFIVTTISTVGYGDYSPVTTMGTVVVSIVILISVMYMALPLGIIGNAFTQIWSARDRYLLTLKTQERLAQWGYTAADMRALFKHFDADGNGELDLAEFVQMIKEMRIGIKQSRIVALFEAFDKDGGGSIDMKELTRALFPATYHEVEDLLEKDDESDEEEHDDQTITRTISNLFTQTFSSGRNQDGEDSVGSNTGSNAA